MLKIESLPTHNLRNHDHLQYMRDFIYLGRKYNPLELMKDKWLETFVLKTEAEDAAMRTESENSKSELLKELNKSRGTTWNAISKRVKSTIISPIAEERSAATQIKRVLDKHKDVRDFDYNAASNVINQLVSDLQLPTNTDALKIMGIDAWVATLQKQNETFIETINERNTEYAESQSGNTKTMRKDVDTEYVSIVEVINASIVLKIAKTETESFVKELNEKIKYYKTTIAHRKGKKNDDEQNTDTPTE